VCRTVSWEPAMGSGLHLWVALLLRGGCVWLNLGGWVFLVGGKMMEGSAVTCEFPGGMGVCACDDPHLHHTCCCVPPKYTIV
jgi:hypothetical protein